MPRRAVFSTVFLSLCLVLGTASLGQGNPPGTPSGPRAETPFPAFGAGSVHLRLYTDYFCPPCRRLEPRVEPILQDLVRKNAATVIFVDMPFSQASILYAQYFLYAWQGRNFPHALRVRTALFKAAEAGTALDKEQLEALLAAQGIASRPCDPAPVFRRYNDLVTEDQIRATPTCVIRRGSQREAATGEQEIRKALERWK